VSKRKYDPPQLKAEAAQWGKLPSLLCLPEESMEYVKNRIAAIEMYMDEISSEIIYDRTGITRASLIRSIERCMKLRPDGTPYGYEALLPFMRINDSSNGKIQQIMDSYPGLEQVVLDHYFSLRPGRAMKRPDKKTSHELFMTELLKRGCTDDKYPFTITDGGYRIFCSWLDKKEEEKKMYLARQTKDAKTKHKTTGMGRRIMTSYRPYSVIQIDGHRLDLIYVVPVKDPNGYTHLMPVERPWLLVAQDVATRCILSYRLVFESEYSSVDVMKLLEGVTAPYVSRPGIRTDGMPQKVFEEAKYALPEVIMLDNALAHYAGDVTDKSPLLGYCFCYGSVASPTSRGLVERTFGVFEQRWGHKVPSTTGSNPLDPVRIKAEQDAIKFNFDRTCVETLVDLAVTTYNNTVHSSLNGMTPIGKMRDMLSLGYLPNRLAPSQRAGFKLYCRREATFRGNKETGKSVYIQKNNYIYSSDSVRSNYNLVGEKVVLHIDPDNITVIHAFSTRGRYLGPLYIKGCDTANTGALTMKQGRDVHEYLVKNGIKPTFGLDDVKTYIISLSTQPATKTEVRKAENIKVGMPELEESIEEEREESIEAKALPMPEAQPEEKTADGYFGVIKRQDKDLSFDDRSPEERQKALRNKYKNYFSDQ